MIQQGRTGDTNLQATLHIDPRRHPSFVPHQFLARAHPASRNHLKHAALFRRQAESLRLPRHPPSTIRFSQPSLGAMRDPHRTTQFYTRDMGHLWPRRVLPRTCSFSLPILPLSCSGNERDSYLRQHHSISCSAGRTRSQPLRPTTRPDRENIRGCRNHAHQRFTNLSTRSPHSTQNFSGQRSKQHRRNTDQPDLRPYSASTII